MSLKTALTTEARLTTQMVLTLSLLRLSGAQVKEAIQRELAENPALETVEKAVPGGRRSSHRLGRQRSGLRRFNLPAQDQGDDPIERLPAPELPIDRLLHQARLSVPACDLQTVEYLLTSLDGHGFLRTPPSELARELGVSADCVERGIHWLHQLDPPGIGARSLRECFLLQCAHLEGRGIDCRSLRRVLEGGWEPFVKQRWEAVSRRTGLSGREVEAVLLFVRENLYPYPLSMVPGADQTESALLQPDLIVCREERQGRAAFRVELPAAEADELRISRTFQDMLRSKAEAGLTPADREWIAQAVERARLFIAGLEQRSRTLRRVGQFIADYQAAFFEGGVRYLKPLTRAEVAQQLGVHESTVSRTVSDKVLQLPDGRLIALSALFDRSLAAKEAIRELLAQAEGPKSDREIAARLEQDSFYLARRTIAKYRNQLHIPAAGRHHAPPRRSAA